MSKNKIIVIAGPTASGKSQLAIDIAVACNGIVVNADSMQVYKDTPIIAACPTDDDKKIVEHRLYEIFEASFNGTVVDWLNLAEKEVKNIWLEGKIPVFVGGTGMYIDNLINGTTPIPEVDKKIREDVRLLERKLGVNEIYNKIGRAHV